MGSWATPHVEKLRAGQTAVFRPRGGSMRGKIESGQKVTVEPLGERAVEVGNIVLCKVKGRYFLHLVKAIRDGRYQIGNNRGHINGWVGRSALYGICVNVED